MRDAVSLELGDLSSEDDTPAASIDPDVRAPFGPQPVDEVLEVTEVAALVRGDGDALDVLGYCRVDDLVNRPVVPEVDDLGALRLEQPPDDVYGCVVPVEQARCRDEADGVARDVKGPGGAAMAPTARVIGSTIVEYKTSRYREEAGLACSTGPLNWPAQLARSAGLFSSVEHGEADRPRWITEMKRCLDP